MLLSSLRMSQTPKFKVAYSVGRSEQTPKYRLSLQNVNAALRTRTTILILIYGRGIWCKLGGEACRSRCIMANWIWNGSHVIFDLIISNRKIVVKLRFLPGQVICTILRGENMPTVTGLFLLSRHSRAPWLKLQTFLIRHGNNASLGTFLPFCQHKHFRRAKHPVTIDMFLNSHSFVRANVSKEPSS